MTKETKPPVTPEEIKAFYVANPRLIRNPETMVEAHRRGEHIGRWLSCDLCMASITPTPPPPSETPRFIVDEMTCSTCHKVTPHRQFGDVIRCSECGNVSSTLASMPSNNWNLQPPPSETAMQSDNQRPMTLDELEAHGYPRDHHERRRFALPPLADSQEGMEGIGPDGGIRARQFRAIQPPPSETKLSEALGALFTCGKDYQKAIDSANPVWEDRCAAAAIALHNEVESLCRAASVPPIGRLSEALSEYDDAHGEYANWIADDDPDKARDPGPFSFDRINAACSSLESLYREQAAENERLKSEMPYSYAGLRIRFDHAILSVEALQAELSALRSLQLTREEARAILKDWDFYPVHTEAKHDAVVKLRRISSKAALEEL